MKSRGLIDFYLPSKIAYHIKIVVASILVAMFFNTMWTGEPFNQNFWIMVGSLIVQLEIFMYLAFKVFPKKPTKTSKSYKKDMIRKLIIFYLLVLVIATAFLMLTIYSQIFIQGKEFTVLLQHFLQHELFNFLTSWIIGIAIGSLIFFYFEWNASLKREQKLKEEKLIFQYETLKSQVNPHFLFNSLNTLSTLVSKDAELSEKFIAKFSSIYRYVLENSNKDFVNLSDELAFVKNYFFLQKIRDDGKIDMEMDIEAPERIEILPMSLQLLVENAIKHNAATKEKPLRIKICKEGDQLSIENNLAPKMQLGSSSKIGLKNLRERVKLVMNKEVTINDSDNTFIVKLPVKLN